MRCKNTHETPWGTYRCEGEHGHGSVHYHSEFGWWPNKQRHVGTWIGFIVVAIIVTAAVLWFILL